MLAGKQFQWNPRWRRLRFVAAFLCRPPLASKTHRNVMIFTPRWKPRTLEINRAGPAIPNAIHLQPAEFLPLECAKLALALIAHVKLEGWRFVSRPSFFVRAQPHGHPFNRPAPRNRLVQL